MALFWKIRNSFAHRISRFTPLTLALFAAVCGGWLLLERLTSEVLETETQRFDERILLALRVPGHLDIPLGPAWILHAVRDLNSLGGVTVLTILTTFATTYLVIARRSGFAAYLLVSVLGGWLISNVVKFWVSRPRPTIVPHLMDVYDLSYPSGHAMMSAVTYLTVAALVTQVDRNRRTRIFLVASAMMLTIAIGLCRIYLGVHYPTDVVAGWCAGSTWALCCWIGARRLVFGDVRKPTDEE